MDWWPIFSGFFVVFVASLILWGLLSSGGPTQDNDQPLDPTQIFIRENTYQRRIWVSDAMVRDYDLTGPVYAGGGSAANGYGGGGSGGIARSRSSDMRARLLPPGEYPTEHGWIRVGRIHDIHPQDELWVQTTPTVRFGDYVNRDVFYQRPMNPLIKEDPPGPW